MDIYEILQSVVLLFLMYVILMSVLFEKKSRICAAPVLPHVKKQMLELLSRHTDLDKSYEIAELGAGWGGVCRSLTKIYKNSNITGYEMSPWPYRVMRLRNLFRKRKFQAKNQSFLSEDISKYDIIYCYLSPPILADLAPMLASLKPESMVITCSFALPNHTPVVTHMVKGIVDIPIFLYKM